MDPSIGVPLLNQTRLDYTVIGFAIAVAMMASIVFGTMPAWQATSIGDVVTRIREEGGSTTSDPKRQRMRSLLIVAETTLAVVLLVGAGLLARSFERLLSVDLGFSADAVQTFGVSLPTAKYSTPLQRQAIHRDAVGARGANPNVESAGAVFGLPLSNFRFGISTSTRDGVTLSDDEQDRLTLQVRLVTPDYFKTMGIPVVKGRGFVAGRSHRRGTGGDAEPDRRRAGVARSGCAGPSPRDRHAAWAWAARGPAARVIGIVGDVRDHGPPRACRRRCTWRMRSGPTTR